MFARDLMTTPLLVCHVNDPLSAAAQRMWDADIGALAVVNDDGKVTGMLTDRDICMAAFTQGRAPESLLVNCAMAQHVVCGRLDNTVSEIEAMMNKHGYRRIPIVDSAGQPIGMVSTSDLVVDKVRHGPNRGASSPAARIG